MNKINYWIQSNRIKIYVIIIVLTIPVMLFSKSEQLRSFCLGVSSVSIIYFIWLGIEKIGNRKKEKIVK